MAEPTVKIGPPPPPQTTPDALFCPAHLKLYWAARQAFKTSESWLRDIKEQPDLMTLVPDDDKGLLLQSGIQVSIETSMLAADSIHALRSALDYLTSALARKSPLGDKRILFPMSDTKGGFEKLLDPVPGEKIESRAKELQKLVGHHPKLKTLLERIKPYPKDGGDNFDLGHALYLVSNADNADKHRFVALAVQLTQASEVVVVLGNGEGDVTLTNLGLMGSGFRFPLGSKFKYQPRFTADVLFPEGSMLAGKPVMGTLVQLIEFTRETISLFEEVFGTE